MRKEFEDNIEIWKKDVEKMKEFEVFLAIEGLGRIIWRENHDYSDGRIEMSKETFEENQEYYSALQKECILMLKNFNVNPESVNDRPNGDYWKWYTFWKNWMDNFSDEEWRKFESKQERKEFIEDLLPKKRWNE